MSVLKSGVNRSCGLALSVLEQATYLQCLEQFGCIRRSQPIEMLPSPGHNGKIKQTKENFRTKQKKHEEEKMESREKN